MQIRQPMNAGVIRYLERIRGEAPDVRPPREKSVDYWECGSHPDVVERIWDQLGKHLPVRSRQVVLGTPALVHRSGVVLAIAIGMQYGLRVPARILNEGLSAGMRTEVTWSTGGQMNIHQEIGNDWVFGTWASVEEAWCLEAFQDQESESGAHT